MKKVKGFTLAEVLITLTILGVVAAITVPSLQKQNYKRTQISRMAKAYSALENAAANIAQKTNCIGRDLKCTGLLDINDAQELNKKFAELSNFRVNKNGQGQTMQAKSLYYETVKTGTDQYPFSIFYTSPDNLAYSIGKINIQQTQNSTALVITVFTDEKKLKTTKGWEIPAIYGRDVFRFVMYDNFQVEPLITNKFCNQFPLSKYNGDKKAMSEDGCDPKKHYSGCYFDGLNCSARIIRDGWKMKY